MSLRHGARQLMDLWEKDEDEELRLIELAIARMKFNPDFATDQLHKTQALILRSRERRVRELPEHIQKAAPPIERRMEEMQRQLREQAQRIAALEHPNVTKFKREA